MSPAGDLEHGDAPLPDDEFASHVDRVRHEMERQGVGALLATAPGDIYWLTGFDSFSGYQLQAAVLGPGWDAPVLWVHEMEAAYAREVGRCEAVVAWSHAEAGGEADDPGTMLARWVWGRIRAPTTIGIEMGQPPMTARVRDRLADTLGAARLVDVTDLVAGLRIVKSEAELARVRLAAKRADTGMVAAVEAVEPGMSERAVAGVLESVLNRLGNEHPSVPHVVLSGDRSVLGHQPPSLRIIEAHDRVVIEVVGVAARYHANVARSVIVGRGSSLIDDACATVIEAVKRCTRAAGPGVPVAELDTLSRSVTRRFDAHRRHRLGYGVEASFPPSMVGPLSISRSSRRVLERGMVFAMAPYLYFPDEPPGSRFAAVFGQDVEITATGSRTLSRLPLEVGHVA